MDTPMTPEQFSLATAAVSLGIAAILFALKWKPGASGEDWNADVTYLLTGAAELAVKAQEQWGGTNEEKLFRAVSFVVEYARVRGFTAIDDEFARGFVEAALHDYFLGMIPTLELIDDDDAGDSRGE